MGAATPLLTRAGLDVLAARNFRLFFFARTVSLFGNGIATVAIVFAVLDATGSASDVGFVTAARQVPLVVFVLVGGVIADRVSRRRLLIATDVANTAAQTLTGLLVVSGHVVLWALLPLQAISGTASAFLLPALTGIIPETAPRNRLQEANSVLRVSEGTIRIAGGAIGGVLVAGFGAGTALFIDAGTFAASGLLLSLLRLEPRARAAAHTMLAELADGWHTVTSHTWIWVVIAHFAFYNALLFAPFYVLGPYVAKQSLGGAAAWGTLVSAYAAGGIAGAVVTLWLKPQRPMFAAYVLLIVAPLPLVMLGLAAPLVLTAVSVFVGGATTAFFGTLWETSLQQHVPGDLLSRVSAWDWLGGLALTPVALALVGPISAAAGVRTTLLGAAVISAGSALAILFVRDIRTMRRHEPVSRELTGIEPQAPN